MSAAHHRARRDVVCPDDGGTCRGETGFTLAEIIVVLAIAAILFGLAIGALGSFKKRSPDNTYNQAASAVWDAVQQYRVDNTGVFPTAAAVATCSSATSLGTYMSGCAMKDAIGTPYLAYADWPKDPTTPSTHLRVSAADAAATPPATGTPHTVVYGASRDQLTAWIAVYDAQGRLAYLRGARASGTPLEPVG